MDYTANMGAYLDLIPILLGINKFAHLITQLRINDMQKLKK